MAVSPRDAKRTVLIQFLRFAVRFRSSNNIFADIAAVRGFTKVVQGSEVRKEEPPRTLAAKLALDFASRLDHPESIDVGKSGRQFVLQLEIIVFGGMQTVWFEPGPAHLEAILRNLNIFRPSSCLDCLQFASTNL